MRRGAGPAAPTGPSQAGHLQRKRKTRAEPKARVLRGAARSCGTRPGERMRAGVRPAHQKSLNFCPGALSPQPCPPGKAHCCCQGGATGFGSSGPDKRGRGRSTPGQSVAHRGVPSGSSFRTPRGWQALTRLLLHNGERNLQSPPNCCKTNPQHVYRAGEKVAKRRAQSPKRRGCPRRPDSPQPAADGGARGERGASAPWAKR